MIDDRVGKAATGVIIDFLEDYIKAYTVNKMYTGRTDYLEKYIALLKYQQGDNYETNNR